MIQTKGQSTILLSDIQEDAAMVASIQVSSAEAAVIDRNLGTSGATHDEAPHPSWKPIPMEIAALLTMRSRIHVLTNV